MHRIPWRTLLIAAAFALLLVPITAIAGDGFTDVEDNNVFVADIQWMADAGITLGCNPPANDRYCPKSNVTREQMAAFMHRLAANQVVDAKTALDADMLDGKDSTAFLGATDTATDADKLDGQDSTTFVQKGEAGSVSSAMVADSVGFATVTESGQVPLGPTTSTIVSVDIQVPAAGYVLVQATYQPVIGHTNGVSDLCPIDVSAVDATLPSDMDPDIFIDAAMPTGTLSLLSASSRAYPVTGGGTNTYYLVGRQLAGNCDVDDSVLTALYVPVDYSTP